MSVRTRLAERLGLELPIFQAPMGGGVAGPPLVAAVCNAGAFGMLPVWAMAPEQAGAAIEEVQRATAKPFAVNLNVAFGPQAHLDLAIRKGVRAAHFFWGDAAPFIARARAAGLMAMVTVASGAEAKAARDAGAEVLIAQGTEAGGHVWGTAALFSLIPAVVDAAGDVPVVAAGGIADGRGLSAALCLGAAGALIGTALIAADESGAHPDYKSAVIAASDGDTVLGTIFDVGWPNAPCRTLRNSTVRASEDALRASEKRPGEGDIVGAGPGGQPIVRYSAAPPIVGMTGELEAMALYAGEGVGLVRKREKAADILVRIANEAAAILRA